MKWLDDLKELNPCDDAITWAERGKFKTLNQAWAKCERGDWMLWLWSKHPKQVTPEIHRKMVLCACEIARKVLNHVSKGEDRPRLAIEAAEKWAENPTEENRAAARATAYAADAAADADYAAAYAAAYAARATADAARATARKESAKVVRKHLKPPTLAKE